MFDKIKSAFSKFGKKAEEAPKEKKSIKSILTEKKLTDDKFNDLFESLEEELLQANVASEVVELIKNKLKEELVNKSQKRFKLEEAIRNKLEEITQEILDKPEAVKMSFKEKPYIVMFVGVNGVGKTTTMAKFANWLLAHKKTCVFAASDTFRAASIEQLQEHADKLKVELIKHKYGSDPAAVAFDAIMHAKARGIDAVLIDTAGRQQANQDLMDELSKVKRIAKPNLIVLVVDSLTGNDAVEQARSFNKAVGVDAVILSKADTDDKGGTVLSIAYVAEKPILFLGVGQRYEDLEEFKSEKVLEKFFK